MDECDDCNVLSFHSVHEAVGANQQLSIPGTRKFGNDTAAFREFRKTLRCFNHIYRELPGGGWRIHSHVLGCLGK